MPPHLSPRTLYKTNPQPSPLAPPTCHRIVSPNLPFKLALKRSALACMLRHRDIQYKQDNKQCKCRANVVYCVGGLNLQFSWLSDKRSEARPTSPLSPPTHHVRSLGRRANRPCRTETFTETFYSHGHTTHPQTELSALRIVPYHSGACCNSRPAK